MMVELGKAEILEGQVAQALDGFVGGEALFLDLFEQLAKGLGVHRRTCHCRLLKVLPAPGGAKSTTGYGGA